MGNIRSNPLMSASVLIWMLLLLTAVSPSYGQNTNSVVVGSTVVIRFLPDGVTNPAQRAAVVQERIDRIIQDASLSPEEIRVTRDPSAGYVIYWGSNLITTVDAEQAKLNKAKPEDLAKVWAQNLKRAVINNAFYIIPNKVDMAINGSIRVRLAGLATGSVAVMSEEGSLGLKVTQEGNELIVQSQKAGRGALILRRGGALSRLTISVKEPAGVIPDKIETEVSGDPAPRPIVQYAAQNAIRNLVRLKPGAILKMSSDFPTEENLRKGRSTTVKVPVEIGGPDYIPVITEIPVIVNNTGASFPTIKKLMVSDRPEAVDRDGILFQSSFNREDPTRLLFYHLNVSRVHRTIWVEVENPHPERVRLQMTSAWAGPDRLGVMVGHSAAVRFLEAHRRSINYTVFIPPRSTMTLVQVPVAPHHVLGGYIHMNILDGRELKVSVKNSTDPDTNGHNLPILHQPFDPFKIHPKGVFIPANLHEEVTYEVGQEEIAACIIGQAPWLIDKVTGEPNNGNYGVFYQFTIKASNPTTKKQRVGLFFVPDSVLAQGTFVLDGKMIETNLVRNPGRHLFHVVDLAPGEERIMDLLTTPEGGSYYPVRVVVETVGENDQPQLRRKQEFQDLIPEGP